MALNAEPNEVEVYVTIHIFLVPFLHNKIAVIMIILSTS